MENRPQQKKMISYLLGELSEVERKHLEEQYFNDNETFVTLLETEEQLINDYLHNHLRRSERRLFEENYLAIPSKESKVEFAQLLDQSERRQELLDRSGSGKGALGSKAAGGRQSRLPKPISQLLELNRALIWSLAVGAAGLLLTIIGTAVWLIRMDRSAPPPPTVATVPTTENQGQTSGEAKSIGPIIGLVVSLELPPRPQKSDRHPLSAFALPIGSGTQEIELRLKLTGPLYPGYRARLQRIDQTITEVAHDDTLKPAANLDPKLVIWKLKAAGLSTGEYQVELHGRTANEEAGDPGFYDFKIRVQ